MNKPLLISLAVLSTISLTALPALAESPVHPAHTHMKKHASGVSHHKRHHSAHIHQGVSSAEPTHAEAKGQLTKAEHKDMHHDMNALSKDIHSEKHDAGQPPKAQ